MNNHSPVLGKTAIILLPPWSPLNAPLGISTVSEIFRQNGVECKAFDWNIELLLELESQYGNAFNRNSELFWDSVYVSDFWKNPDFIKHKSGILITNWIQERLEKLIAEGFTTFGFSAFESNTNITRFAIQMLRKLQPNALILIGGPATHNMIEYKYNDKWLADIDFIFYKEVEETLPLFIKNFKNINKNKEVPGTAFVKPQALLTFQYFKRIVKRVLGYKVKDNYQLIFTPFNQTTNLKSIPPISFDYLKLKNYKSGGIPLEFSRGCVGACTFCSETVRYRPYRGRPMEDLIRDIKIAIEKYEAVYFCLICSALNGNKKHLTAFCEALIDQKIKIRWGGNARLDYTLDEELLSLMAKAGCNDLDFGLESGSDHVLGLMNKKSDVKTASEIINICYKLNIDLAVNLIVGFPGETEENFQETIDFIEKHYKMVAIFNVSKCYLDGSAPLGKHPEKFGLLMNGKKVLAVDPNHSQMNTMPAIVANGPHWSDWCTTTGDNTPYIRNQCYQRVLETIDRLGKRGNTPHDSRKSNDLTYHET